MCGGKYNPSTWCSSGLRLSCSCTSLFGLPSFVFSVTATQEKVVGLALGLNSSDICVSLMGAICYLLGVGVLVLRHVALGLRWFLLPFAQGRLQAGRARLVSSGLLCDYLALQLIRDVGASLAVYKQVRLVFSFRLRLIVLNTKPREKLMCRTWMVLRTAAWAVC